MSLPAPVDLAVARPLLHWRRDYAATVLTVTLAGHQPLVITPGHPVLTHTGWRRPALLVPGDQLVVTDATPGADAEDAYRAAREARGEYRLPTLFTDFRGDGDLRESHVVCLDDRAWPPPRPWVGNEGHPPRADPAATQDVLDALCTLAEFRVGTWTQACERVPGLAEAYPDGPVAHRRVLDEATCRRLGSALAALPAPPVNRTALGARLLGLPAALRLAQVTELSSEPGTAVVHDVTAAGGAMLAAGVVVAA